jgi:hypothetical protein
MKLGRLAVKMGNVTTLKLRQVIRTMNKDWWTWIKGSDCKKETKFHV